MDYLTQDELLYALEHEGLEVSERTVRFWISKGVLEKPLRKPFKHADGRMRYFPTRVVGEIVEIMKLQEEGWKLTQIKHRLRTPPKVGQAASAGAEDWAKLWLADFLGNGEFKDRFRNIESAEPSTPPWRRVRNFLVARLTHFVGRKQAVRSVTSFMLGLSKRDTAKLLRLTSGSRSDQTEIVSPDLKWSNLDKAQLKVALSRLVEPSWDGPGPEPILSRQLRQEVLELNLLLNDESAAGEDKLKKRMVRLSKLREQVGESLDYLLKTPNDVNKV